MRHIFLTVRNEQRNESGLRTGLKVFSVASQEWGVASLLLLTPPPTQRPRAACCNWEACWKMASPAPGELQWAALTSTPGQTDQDHSPYTETTLLTRSLWGHQPQISKRSYKSQETAYNYSSTIICKRVFTNKEKKSWRTRKRGKKTIWPRLERVHLSQPPNFWPNVETLFTGDNSGMYPKLHNAT